MRDIVPSGIRSRTSFGPIVVVVVACERGKVVVVDAFVDAVALVDRPIVVVVSG